LICWDGLEKKGPLSFCVCFKMLGWAIHCFGLGVGVRLHVRYYEAVCVKEGSVLADFSTKNYLVNIRKNALGQSKIPRATCKDWYGLDQIQSKAQDLGVKCSLRFVSLFYQFICLFS
jgi:hypothetical protein